VDGRYRLFARPSGLELLGFSISGSGAGSFGQTSPCEIHRMRAVGTLQGGVPVYTGLNTLVSNFKIRHTHTDPRYAYSVRHSPERGV
jgi:hypothetical protein